MGLSQRLTSNVSPSLQLLTHWDFISAYFWNIALSSVLSQQSCRQVEPTQVNTTKLWVELDWTTRYLTTVIFLPCFPFLLFMGKEIIFLTSKSLNKWQSESTILHVLILRNQFWTREIIAIFSIGTWRR